jgi:hypothetical protein
MRSINARGVSNAIHAICGIYRSSLSCGICYRSGRMKPVRTMASVLVTSVLALSASAQQVESIQFADRLVPTSFAGVASLSSSNAAPAPEGSPLFRPVTPEQPVQHKFFDRQQLLALYVHSGVRLADTIKTCRAISHGGVEDWIPTQSCSGIAAWQAGSVGLTLGVGWLFHKHGHHLLERITPWVGTGASAAGLTKSVFNLH